MSISLWSQPFFWQGLVNKGLGPLAVIYGIRV